MTLVRWDPFHELEAVSERLNRLFGRPVAAATTGKEHLTVCDWSPAVEVAETSQEYLIKVDLPEVRKEDVKVSLESDVLCIQGERRREKEEKDKKYHRIEREYGSFFRSFALPDDVEGSKVKAEFKEGVLSVHLAKSERAKPRAIDVRVS